MATSKLTITVRDMPEVLAELLRHTADALRQEADAEADPRVARKLRKVAAQIEAGQ